MRLQTAVDALGDDSSPEAKMLRDAFEKVQQEATTTLVGVRLCWFPICRESEEQVVQSRRSVAESTRRTRQVGAGVEGWRTAIGGSSSGGFPTAHTPGGLSRGRSLENGAVHRRPSLGAEMVHQT